LDPAETLHAAEAGELGESGPESFAEQLEAAEVDVVVECIPQNIRSGEPALGHHRAALEAGVHVVTANKTPIALGYRDLRHRAAKGGACFRFEATVLDGLPLFAFVAQLHGQRVVRARGVLNATSSVVLEAVGNGASRSRGLARAQAQGIAEADVVLDLDGWDAAAKAAVLANVWMDGSLRVVDVDRTGCDAVKDQKIKASTEEGGPYRLVATLERGESGVLAQVAPVALSGDDPFRVLHGAQGGLEVETDLGHRFCFLQRAAGLHDAAGGLLADCRAIAAGAPQV
jgi:homoserine dehydrogenase